MSQGRSVSHKVARATSKQAVDERRERGAFGQDEDESEGYEQDHDRGEPPFFYKERRFTNRRVFFKKEAPSAQDGGLESAAP